MAKAKSAGKASAPTMASDDKWQAESDARTIAQAHSVQCDPKRMKAAGEAAARLLKEKKEEMKGLEMAATKAAPAAKETKAKASAPAAKASSSKAMARPRF